jgi:transcriptional regulator with XRE-family HTH domain
MEATDVVTTSDRPGLADFLRRRRAGLRPSDVGLPEGVRRRTPGLRRDEVATLAGMSTDYYTRLEQGRGPHPSAQLLTALGRALRCDVDQSDHLFHLAGLVPPRRRGGAPHLRPGLIAMADHLADVPVCILSDIDDELWSNGLADAVVGPVVARPGRAVNYSWAWFTDPSRRERFPREDWVHLSATHVNDLRATAARRAGDDDVEVLVRELRAASAEFDELWLRHDVAVRQFDRKRIQHPEVGLIHLTCEVLATPSADVRLVVFLPTDGTDARDKLDLLRVIGTQDLTSTR